MATANEERTVLRDLSLPVRLTIAAFLMSVGLGYLAALVQLKVQQASPGELLPTPENAIETFHGGAHSCQLLRLLKTSDTQPFNGQGSMRAAFTKKRSGGWAKAVKLKGEELQLDPKDPANEAKLNDAVALDRDGERQALVEWVEQGFDQQEYDDDKHLLSDDLARNPITSGFVEEIGGKKYAKVRSIITDRCERCHGGGAGFGAAQYPLTKYDEITLYCIAEKGPGMSLPKLAQTTHVHLLGFSMLWGLTGLIFAFTSYPGWIRFLIAPLALIAQIVDISFWWLARIDVHGVQFAKAVTISGGVVGLALFLQIVGSLFNLFGYVGKAVLVLLLGGAIGGGAFLFVNVVNPYVKAEAPTVAKVKHEPVPAQPE